MPQPERRVPWTASALRNVGAGWWGTGAGAGSMGWKRWARRGAWAAGLLLAGAARAAPPSTADGPALPPAKPLPGLPRPLPDLAAERGPLEDDAGGPSLLRRDRNGSGRKLLDRPLETPAEPEFLPMAPPNPLRYPFDPPL